MKFSIITCTYNSEEYLQKNIDSMESQIFDDFEHIFIDGFSNDKTIEIIKKYQEKYPDKVKLFQSKPKGISHAMNEGIKKVSGKYINHLHSDDFLCDKNVLKDVNNFIVKNSFPEMVYGKMRIENVENHSFEVKPHRKIHEEFRFWLLLLTNYIPHQAVFLQKEVFDKYGDFDENLKNSMDYDLWVRLSKNKINARFFNRMICNFSVRWDSQSSKGRYNNDRSIIYRKYFKNPIFIYVLCSIHKLHRLLVYKLSRVYSIK